MTSPVSDVLQMYLSTKYGGQGSNGNGDINCYISSYLDTSGKGKHTASIRHIKRFSKSGILIYNSEAPETASRKKKKEENEE